MARDSLSVTVMLVAQDCAAWAELGMVEPAETGAHLDGASAASVLKLLANEFRLLREDNNLHHERQMHLQHAQIKASQGAQSTTPGALNSIRREDELLTFIMRACDCTNAVVCPGAVGRKLAEDLIRTCELQQEDLLLVLLFRDHQDCTLQLPHPGCHKPI